MDPRGSYFDPDEAGGGVGRKRSAREEDSEEEEEEAPQFGSFSEKRIRMDSVQDDHSWSYSYPSTSQSVPSNVYASSSSRSSRSLSTSSFSTVGSPQDRYRPSQYLPIEPLSTPLLPSPPLSTPTLPCSFAQPNAYAMSEDNSFGLSFSTQVDPFGLGSTGAEWWEVNETDETPVVETVLVGLVDGKAGVAGSSLGWNEDLGWSELTSSPETVSQQPFLDSSYPSTPSDQLATSQNHSLSPPSSQHHHDPTSHIPSPFHPPPPRPPPYPVRSHQTRSRNFYQERVAALNARGARPSFVALPVGSTSSYSSGSNSGENFSSALGRIRREQGQFKLVFPTVRGALSPPALA